jgi:hypothetical protein
MDTASVLKCLTRCCQETHIKLEVNEMKGTKYLAALALSLLVLLVACSPAVSVVVVTSTPDPERTPNVVFVTATPTPTSTPGPDVTVYYEGYAQFELISPEGRRVLIDVFDPDL